jgi:carbon-monoxide dehydrogenase small subunit
MIAPQMSIANPKIPNDVLSFEMSAQETVKRIRIKLNVNGSDYFVDLEKGYELLSEVLRDRLGLTGTKRGCDFGGCGCCSLMIDNELFYSCMMPAIRAVGKKITTIEGLEKDGVLSAVQQGFVDHFAFQCGYCTPGMIMSGTALLAEIPNPTEDQIKEGIGGVICRCTGYVKIIEAIKAASEAKKNS